MTTDWKNRIKNINYRHGLDRFYFVLTLAWFLMWFFALLVETLDTKVNLYTDNLAAIVWGHIFALATPFVIYIILILALKILLWILSGFRKVDTTTPSIKVKIFSDNDSFFGLVRKHRILIVGIIIVLALVGLIISFMFTSYSSHEQRRNARDDLQFNFGNLPPLPKLPALPKPPSYVPVDER